MMGKSIRWKLKPECTGGHWRSRTERAEADLETSELAHTRVIRDLDKIIARAEAAEIALIKQGAIMMEKDIREWKLKPEHWLIEESKICPACDERFKADDHITLVAIGPGADPDNRRKCREGRPYIAVSVPAHYACVTGIT
jgi:hypothetical protein